MRILRLVSDGRTPCASADKAPCEIGSAASPCHKAPRHGTDKGAGPAERGGAIKGGGRGEESSTNPLGPLLLNEHECDEVHGVCMGTPDRQGCASWGIQLRALPRVSGKGRDLQPSGYPSKRFQLLEKPAVGFSFSSPQMGDPRAVPAQPNPVLKGFEALGPGQDC